MRHPRVAALTFSMVLAAVTAAGQANGKLQIHFIDVGQGDGAILVSPEGETVLFDNGVANDCDRVVSYLQQLGLKKIDYHIASHYHSDHIGCTAEVFQQFPLVKTAFDRGGQYNSAVYKRYLAAVGERRKTAEAGAKFSLGAGTGNPVEIEIVALNGNGIATSNENDLSVVAVVHFGKFDAEIGGDLSGYKNASYEDIETGVAEKMNQIEVYKIHHHCSRYSSNDNWLAKTKPMVGIISTGDGNGYGHPAEECLERLHAANVETYWTERGAGASPEPGLDVVGGNILVEVELGGDSFTVTRNGAQTDNYKSWEASGTSPGEVAAYAWSKRSNVYHYSNCKYVANISPGNLMQGSKPPEGKTLHQGCPK